MEKEELGSILELHRKWLHGEPGGENADLHGADLRDADLGGADMHGADLGGADLGGADMSGAYLNGAAMRGVKLGALDKARLSIVPQEGPFIAWKKCIAGDLRHGALVKLLVPSDAKRSNAAGRKCRVSKAHVLSIRRIPDGEPLATAMSIHDRGFAYKAGCIVEPDSFDDDRWDECSNGIHCFVTKEEAIDY